MIIQKQIFVCPECGQIEEYRIIGTFEKTVKYDHGTIKEENIKQIGKDKVFCSKCGNEAITSTYNVVQDHYVPDLKIDEIGLSSRARNGLIRKIGCHLSVTDEKKIYMVPTICDIIQLVSEKDLKKFRGIGEKTAKEIIDKLSAYGITLRKE